MGCLFHYPQSFIRTFPWIWIGWFIRLSVQTFRPLIVIYRWGNFVYRHWECTSIYRPLSYPFWSLWVYPSLLLCAEFGSLKLRVAATMSWNRLRVAVMRLSGLLIIAYSGWNFLRTTKQPNAGKTAEPCHKFQFLKKQLVRHTMQMTNNGPT